MQRRLWQLSLGESGETTLLKLLEKKLLSKCQTQLCSLVGGALEWWLLSQVIHCFSKAFISFDFKHSKYDLFCIFHHFYNCIT